MKIISHPFICPCCRLPGTAFLADCHKPPHDEIAPDKKSLLCNECERWFVNVLFQMVGKEVRGTYGMETLRRSVSALCPKAQSTGEPGPTAADSTGDPGRVPDEVPGLSPEQQHGNLPNVVLDSPTDAHPPMRGQALFPSDGPY